jgi:RND superfamily putative drug exporter
MWCSRHRWPVFALWFIGTIGLFLVSLPGGGIKAEDPNGNPNQAQTESAKAYAAFQSGGTNAPTEDVSIVITHPSLKVTDQAYQAYIARDIAALKALTVDENGTTVPAFDSVSDPATAPPEAGLVAPDLSTVRLVATIKGDQATVDQHLVPVRPAITAIESDGSGFTVHSVSGTLTNEDITNLINSSLDTTFITIGLTFVILLMTFGAVAAAVVPIVLALTALVGAFGIFGLFSQAVNPVSPYASQLIILIGLAVSVDYSLFMITRFRSERRRGRDKLVAIEIASATAGRAVFFSGLAVMISVAGLFIIDVSIFRSMAIGTIGVIFISIIGSLTFLPATLAILGDRVNLGRIPFFGRSREEGSGVWARMVRIVMRRPVGLGAAAVLLLLVLALPWLHLRIGLTDFTSFPDKIDGVQAVKLLNEKWPQGSTQTLQVAVTGFDRPETKAAVTSFQEAGLGISGLSQPVTVTPSHDGKAALVSFTMAGTDQNDPRSAAIVREVRSKAVPAAFGGLAGNGVQAYVTGNAAQAVDITAIYTDAMPLIFAFVLGMSFLLLLVVFHSIVIPIKAIVLNLLSAGAAYGVVVAVFQDDILHGAFGIATSSVIESWVPIFIFTILFGLSMDYHVFILTRVKEARDRGLDSRAAVARGIAITSGTITSAATIMVVVFITFVTIPFAFIQELGLGLAVAVLIDATIVRSVLLPASMTVLGDWNWWLPRFLGWLPRITIEGEPEADADDVGQPEAVPA